MSALLHSQKIKLRKFVFFSFLLKYGGQNIPIDIRFDWFVI